MPRHRQNIMEVMTGEPTVRWMAFVSFLFLFLAIMNVSVTKAFGANTLTVSATVLSRNQCKFNSSNSTLNFGALDTGSSSDVTQSTSVQFVCRGSAPLAAFAFLTDDGLYDTGPGQYRMRHATVPAEFLPYSLSLSPTTGTVPKNVTRTLTISGTVKAIDYQPAQIGNYADTVVITLNP